MREIKLTDPLSQPDENQAEDSMINVSDISCFLGKTHNGPDQPVMGVADLAECGPGDMVWIRRFSSESSRLANERGPALVICDQLTALNLHGAFIVSENPRLDFIRATTRFFAQDEPSEIHPSAVIDSDAIIGQRVSIGAHSYIGPRVIVGDGCRIGPGVCIEGPTEVGRFCRIKANAVIGAAGFGFEREADGTPTHFPHFGRVILEDGVWIGACSTVERAALGTTRLCRNAKIDDLVQIGHGVLVGANSLVMANVVLCGGAIIGEACWIAPGSVVKEKIKIGTAATVGLGAVVIRDVESKTVVAGVPAKPLRIDRVPNPQ